MTSCPLEFVTDDIWRLIEFADLYRKGLPPIAGGALDQMRSFICAAQIVFRERQYWKNKLQIIG